MADETPLQVARRHVRQQEGLIATQKAIIERLAAAGQSTELAEETLRTMERTLALALSEVARHSDRTVLPPRGPRRHGKVGSIPASIEARWKQLT